MPELDTVPPPSAPLSPSTNLAIALGLWFFLGYLGAHRFYQGRVGSGIAILLLFALGAATSVILIGFIPLLVVFLWWLIDGIGLITKLGRNNRAGV